LARSWVARRVEVEILSAILPEVPHSIDESARHRKLLVDVTFRPTAAVAGQPTHHAGFE
jgi:hypothetical protein